MYASTDLYTRAYLSKILIVLYFCIVFLGVESKKHFCLPAHPCQDVSIETEWMIDRIDELMRIRKIKENYTYSVIDVLEY